VTRPFSFHPDARVEFRETVRFYEAQRRGVGADLAKELRSSIDQILEHPLSGSPGHSGTRRVFLPHFPYTLVYIFEEGHLKIIAIAHQRRRPGYWQHRVTTTP
jgi:plasmid stabilization system protein ParE